MDLTPNEMKSHQFASAMRGYDKAEVKAFVDAAADALEDARADLLKLKEEYRTIQIKYEQLHNLEDTIKSAVLEAQKNANQILANARKEAQLVSEEARLNADKVLEKRQQHLSKLDSKIKEMEYTRETFYSKLRSEIEAHLKLVDSICPQESEMQSEEVKPNGDQAEDYDETPEPETRHQEPEKTEPQNQEPESTEPQDRERKKPSLDMQDDEIDNVVDKFGPVVEAAEQTEQQAPPPQQEQPQDKAPIEQEPRNQENNEETEFMSDREIDSVIDRLDKHSGGEQEEGETVRDGQSQDKNF